MSVSYNKRLGMNWKPILIRKAARARQQFNTACWGIILLALAIVYKVWQEGDWGPISPDGENGFLWLAGGMLVSAWLLVLVDCFLRPEESPRAIRQSKIRHWVFLFVWAVIIVVCMWGKHFFFWLLPCGLWLGYAYGFRALHKAFYLVEHPHDPKSILLGLPIENILNRYNLAFGLGLLFAGVSLLLWVLGLGFPVAWQLLTLAAAGLCSLLTVGLLVPTIAVRLGAIQKYKKWLWQVIKHMPFHKSKSEKAQFDLWVWYLTNPGKTEPPEDLLEAAFADQVRLLLPGAVSEWESGKRLPEFLIGSQADFLAQYQGNVLPAQEITPLFQAALQQDVKAMRRLLPDPLHLNQPYAGNGNTLLHIAVWNENIEMVKLLLEQPYLNKTIPNNAGKTPLDLAQEKQLTEIVSLLKDK